MADYQKMYYILCRAVDGVIDPLRLIPETQTIRMNKKQHSLVMLNFSMLRRGGRFLSSLPRRSGCLLLTREVAKPQVLPEGETISLRFCVSFSSSSEGAIEKSAYQMRSGEKTRAA